MRQVFDSLPSLVPTHGHARSSLLWRVTCGVGTAVSLGLLLVGVLCVVTASCTIERVILYNTETLPSPRRTP